MSLIPIEQQLTDHRFHKLRLIATDMNGTLTQRGKFTASLLQAFEDLIAADIPVLIVTGRSAGWVSGKLNAPRAPLISVSCCAFKTHNLISSFGDWGRLKIYNYLFPNSQLPIYEHNENFYDYFYNLASEFDGDAGDALCDRFFGL